MIDKRERMEGFSKQIESSFNYAANFISSSLRNLLLVNVNTYYTWKILKKYLDKQDLIIIKPHLKDIIAYGSLGDFLRYYTNEMNSIARNQVLVLDFFDSLSDLYKNDSDIIDEINVNRDLFTRAFNSTIIITSQNETHQLMRFAYDFWSCVDVYVDTTKWFCTPVMLPITKVRTFPQISSLLVDFYQNNKDVYLQYVYLKNLISSTAKYSHEIFTKLYMQIKAFPKGICYYDLINHFAYVMTNIEAPPSQYTQRIEDVFILKQEYSVLSLEMVDVQIILAEFFYKSAMYTDAISCYQNSTQLLEEMWDNESKEYFVSVLCCNIAICKYLKDGVHNPVMLIDELKLRLEYSGNCNIENQKLFSNLYLELVSCTVQHRTGAQHANIYNKLKNEDIPTFSMLDLSETISTLLVWEEYIAKNFSPICKVSNVSVLLDINVKFQMMISLFCNGDYKKARIMYKQLKYKARSHGYEQLVSIASTIWNNMKYLHKNGDYYD